MKQCWISSRAVGPSFDAGCVFGFSQLVIQSVLVWVIPSVVLPVENIASFLLVVFKLLINVEYLYKVAE